jgi:hypothetical protein
MLLHEERRLVIDRQQQRLRRQSATDLQERLRRRSRSRHVDPVHDDALEVARAEDRGACPVVHAVDPDAEAAEAADRRERAVLIGPQDDCRHRRVDATDSDD